MNTVLRNDDAVMNKYTVRHTRIFCRSKILDPYFHTNTNLKLHNNLWRNRTQVQQTVQGPSSHIGEMISD